MTSWRVKASRLKSEELELTLEALEDIQGVEDEVYDGAGPSLYRF